MHTGCIVFLTLLKLVRIISALRVHRVDIARIFLYINQYFFCHQSPMHNWNNNINSFCFTPIQPPDKIGNTIVNYLGHLSECLMCASPRILPFLSVRYEDLSSLEIIAAATDYSHLPLGIVISRGGPTSSRHHWCHEDTVRLNMSV